MHLKPVRVLEINEEAEEGKITWQALERLDATTEIENGAMTCLRRAKWAKRAKNTKSATVLARCWRDCPGAAHSPSSLPAFPSTNYLVYTIGGAGNLAFRFMHPYRTEARSGRFVERRALVLSRGVTSCTPPSGVSESC